MSVGQKVNILNNAYLPILCDFNSIISNKLRQATKEHLFKSM